MDTALDTSLNPVAAHERIHDLRFVSPVVTTPPPPRSVKLTLATFVFCLVALFASAIVLSAEFTEADGPIVWVMILMGAAIIALLLGGALLPFMKEVREHRRA
ncbi:MAG: hypothetical protein ABI382_13635 [Nakamurella sp.]